MRRIQPEIPAKRRLLRLLFCNENRGHGGAEHYTAQLALRLLGRGHQVQVAARPGSWLAQQDLPLLSIPFASELDPLSWGGLYLGARRLRADILHCHADRDLANAAVASLGLRAGLIRSQHTHSSARYSPLLGWAYRRCHSVVSVSDAHLRHSRQVLPGGVRHRRIYNAVAGWTPVPPPPRMREGYWVGYVGGFFPSKRVEDVIAACADWLVREPQARLLLLGDGPERERIQQQCAAFGEKVWLPGHDSPAGYLAGLKLLLHAGREETFSLACVEALAAGVPVVARPRGGLPEVVEHGVCGWLGEELRAGLEIYLADEELRLRHARAAPRQAERFAWEPIVREWEELYSAASPRNR